MIEIERAALEEAIRAGANAAGEWRVCKVDGAVYWHGFFYSASSRTHRQHDYLRLPSIFPEGAGTQYRFFCAWAKKMASPRGEHLLTLARGAPHRLAYAIPAILDYLTPQERASWERYISEHVGQYADGCMTALNNASRRARYRFRHPTRETEIEAC